MKYILTLNENTLGASLLNQINTADTWEEQIHQKTFTQAEGLVVGTNTISLKIQFGKLGRTGFTDNTYLDDLSVNLTLYGTALSINNFEKFDFNFAPNPAKNFINLSAANSIEKVEVYNLLGKKALSTRINNDRSTLDISELASGMYVMQVTIDKQVGTYKIIKE
jgi:hypothetical protein